MTIEHESRDQRRHPPEDAEIRKLANRLVTAGVAFLGLIAVGAFGYRLIAPATTWVDAVYMTVITLTTVGFGEVVDLSASPGGRLFTMALLMTGLGLAAYLATTVTALIVDGHLREAIWRRRMQREADRMEGHLIVCGSDETALQAARELAAVDRTLVMVCDDPSRVERIRERLPDVTLLVGDPADEAVLRDARADRAAGLVACAADDKDNLVVALTARNLNPDIRIISRATLPEMGAKMTQVGADAVVNPSVIGGLRMASELVRPAVVTFLDQMLRDRDRNLRVSEVAIAAGAPAVGRTIASADPVRGSRSLLLACRRPDGQWLYNPPSDYVVEEGATLIVMGSPAEVETIRHNVNGRRA